MTAPRFRAALVHLYTASGVLLAFLATAEICTPAPDVRVVFVLLAAAVLIDATDGTLARRWEVKRWLPGIDGRTIDDLVDYLTYTFVPLLLIWRMGWLPEPAFVWVAPALIASLFGFANTGAKDESGGFFLGFPSYWNVVAFYAGLAHRYYGPWVNAIAVLFLALLTVLPVRFLYPTLAPRSLAGSTDRGRPDLAGVDAGDPGRLCQHAGLGRLVVSALPTLLRMALPSPERPPLACPVARASTANRNGIPSDRPRPPRAAFLQIRVRSAGISAPL